MMVLCIDYNDEMLVHSPLYSFGQALAQFILGPFNTIFNPHVTFFFKCLPWSKAHITKRNYENFMLQGIKSCVKGTNPLAHCAGLFVFFPYALHHPESHLGFPQLGDYLQPSAPLYIPQLAIYYLNHNILLTLKYFNHPQIITVPSKSHSHCQPQPIHHRRCPPPIDFLLPAFFPAHPLSPIHHQLWPLPLSAPRCRLFARSLPYSLSPTNWLTFAGHSNRSGSTPTSVPPFICSSVASCFPAAYPYSPSTALSSSPSPTTLPATLSFPAQLSASHRLIPSIHPPTACRPVHCGKGRPSLNVSHPLTQLQRLSLLLEKSRRHPVPPTPGHFVTSTTPPHLAPSNTMVALNAHLDEMMCPP
ncbi:hypothetical protein VP01_2190g2 [Puccinia sorghi]|uniref:Uncharacterized protein n=1 Tax=Puccinia sorghi TaxID=27349 RepID=A0A0L6V9Q5_9BASI|nr:hypothetical protein VP01_2190g2 [Puccinia sorghi]